MREAQRVELRLDEARQRRERSVDERGGELLGSDFEEERFCGGTYRKSPEAIRFALPSPLMSTFQMRHEMDMTAEKFWELFFNNDLQKDIFLKCLKFPKWELVEFTDGDKEIIRVTKAQPKMEVPGAVAKLIGDGFGYTERGSFDKGAKVYKYKITPTTMADKIKNEGAVKVEAKPGSGEKCTRIVDITMECKIFGVGGMIEKAFEKQTREGWEESAKFLNEHVKKA